RLATLEDQMGDIGTVMDAAGSQRAVVFATNDGSAPAAVFSAAHPERVVALVLYEGLAKFLATDDYPWGVPEEVVAHWLHRIERAWGRDIPEDLAFLAPSRMSDTAFRRWYAQFCRLSASPSAIAELLRIYIPADTRSVLPAIRVPTLVLNRADNIVRIENARYYAEHVPGARLVELPGHDMLLYAGDVDAVVDEVQEFVTGVRDAPETDRVLATVLITDIVGSTERATALGDRRWRDVLDAHDQLVDRELARFRGRKVNPTGDGMLATFDGPARAVRCAQSLIAATPALDLQIRAGLHTGEVELRGDDIGGIAVHIGARVSALAGPGEVLVSRTVTDLVAGSGIDFEDRGEYNLKGIPEPWRLFAVSP
ncbi:MAG TPA: adenylate/guanylate cyclase domain-containing protein, partial [Acidimicrobiia bacterium]|nr:adenylate/guanylate cyclase domain-containing protein [Acidimicrobiia bacterium]